MTTPNIEKIKSELICLGQMLIASEHRDVVDVVCEAATKLYQLHSEVNWIKAAERLPQNKKNNW